jgi:type VI secretion system protein ImpK
MVLMTEQSTPSDQSIGLALARTGVMSDLLRDTALLVSTLRAGGHAVSFDALRTRCRQLLEQLDEALERREFARDERDEALGAQCALLDETALRHLSGIEQDNWAARPLQVEKFGKHDLGEDVFMRLNERMRAPSPAVELLECYATILGLGFTGRYAIDGEAKRQALLADLSGLLARMRPTEPAVFIAEKSGAQLGWLRRTSPWIFAAVCCLFALLVWIAWHFYIEASVASSIAPLTSKPTSP